MIAIDGPAASGKSTVAAELARRLGLLLIDSGSMYRAVALLAIERGVGTSDEEALAELAMEVRSGYRLERCGEGAPRVTLDGRDVSDEIRGKAVGEAVSQVSAHPAVREQMVALQRETAGDAGAVVEGRDIGTTVFPGARLKVYLEASVAERVSRRTKELDGKGMSPSHRDVEGEIEMRDSIDSTRKASPLAKADDALVIDTESRTAKTVADEIIAAWGPLSE